MSQVVTEVVKPSGPPKRSPTQYTWSIRLLIVCSAVFWLSLAALSGYGTYLLWLRLFPS
jgi:hypothetical protein